jgi:hypothetical protein
MLQEQAMLMWYTYFLFHPLLFIIGILMFVSFVTSSLYSIVYRYITDFMKIGVLIGNTETLVIDHHMGNLEQTGLLFNKVG